MSDSAPIRPQRLIRTNRETTGGLLMSVIRTLTTSRDSADRDRERIELEKGFQQCDSKLNDLMGKHGNDLYQVMNIFSKILNSLSRSRERLSDTRDKLLNCQKLLHCKREELKKLWLDVIENRAVFNLLERVENLALLPKQLEEYAEKKHYLHAGQCCIDGLRQLKSRDYNAMFEMNKQINHSLFDCNNQNFNPTSSLSEIEALREVKSDLLGKKEFLFEKCIDELHRHLYVIATDDLCKRYLQEQQQKSRVEINSDKISESFFENSKFSKPTEKSGLEVKNTSDISSMIFRKSNPNSETFESYPEEDSRQFILMLTKCIGLLDKVPEAVKIIRERFDDELINLVIRTAQELLAFTEPSEIESFKQQQQQQFHSDSVLKNNAPLSFFATSNPKHYKAEESNLTVLTCTRLLGHHYNGFSHSTKRSEQKTKLRLPRNSIQLQRLFILIMKQTHFIMQLHDSIVLPNLEKIQMGLHASSSSCLDPTGDLILNDAYSSSEKINFTDFHDEIRNKSESIIQQFLDFFLDASQLSNQVPSIPAVCNYKLMPTSTEASSENFSTSSSLTDNNVLTGLEKYSSFFQKRRTMTMADAMNAMMTTGKHSLNVSNHYQLPANENSENQNSAKNLIQESNPSNPNLYTSASSSNILQSITGSNPWRSPHNSLFKFDNSTQAMSWNNFQKQQSYQDTLKNKDEISNGDHDHDHGNLLSSARKNFNDKTINQNKLFECLQQISNSTPDNFVLLYDIMLTNLGDYLRRKSSSRNLNDKQKSSLLQSYVVSSAEKFTQLINSQLDSMLEQAQKSLELGLSIELTENTFNDSLASVENGAPSTSVNQYERTSKSCVLLESAVLIDIAVRDLHVLMSVMSNHSQHYLGLICNVLVAYKDFCKRFYNSLTDEILLLARALLELIQKRSNENFEIETPKTAFKIMITQQMSTSMSFDESPENILRRNANEIDILINLLSQEITQEELLRNEGQLTNLANMQQSFEWLSARSDDLVQLIQQQQLSEDQQNNGSTDLTEVLIATLNQLSSEFEEIGQLCLMVLHLEIRVHCFYHLQALDAQFFTTAASRANFDQQKVKKPASNDISEDCRIIPLLEDLKRMHSEISAAHLSSNKMNYLFEGLGQLITTIFMNAVMSMRRVKPNGIKRACRAIYDIQRRLSTIVNSRESSLDYARQYFELLLTTPDEVISGIIERGKLFKPQEYISAITLLHQSGIDPEDSKAVYDSNQNLRSNLKRLEEILNDVR
ncbi:Exocyst complex component 4 [Sarcoptes scabiei]|uniref:Exocyst complex component Sec8 n=1 Tax=Sarcoptes scabiei TaxID=52283 RepID=A0A834RGR0_SARSC|nr:Exocyst complex component 4 [Sarcoptes scabiei]